MKYLESNHKELLFIDEFIYSSHSNKQYGWCKKSENSIYNAPLDDFRMSFMIWFSKLRIYGVIGTNETFDSNMFLQFLIQMKENLHSNWVFIADNASIHKTNQIREYLEDTKQLLITIPSYSPCLNPWEHLIRSIKSKIRMKQRANKLITLSLIKGIIDEIDKSDLNRLQISSIKETINFINQ